MVLLVLETSSPVKKTPYHDDAHSRRAWHTLALLLLSPKIGTIQKTAQIRGSYLTISFNSFTSGQFIFAPAKSMMMMMVVVMMMISVENFGAHHKQM